MHTPIKQPPGTQILDADNRAYNALIRGLRGLDERGFVLITQR
ncbi:transposase family protein [Actinopolyspora lacussalsi]|nr:transposase family protein [Actinopolyspora righensis]